MEKFLYEPGRLKTVLSKGIAVFTDDSTFEKLSPAEDTPPDEVLFVWLFAVELSLLKNSD